MKKSFIIANWKMNPRTLKEAKNLFNSVKKGIKSSKGIEVIVSPPFIYLPLLGREKSKIKLASQNIFWEENGAFTGEISPLMLKNLGVEYAIVGHSERRALGETDAMINKKIRLALKLKLKPILCLANFVQLKKSLKGISEKIILAYEPVFSIGTGKPCSVKKAKEIRKKIKYPLVLYGGSVNSQNAESYLKEGGFQGLLIGGASLNAKEFVKIVNLIREIK